MRVVVIMETTESRLGFDDTRVAAVCEDWKAAEQEKARLRGLGSMSKYYLIEKTITKRNKL
tara:strand:+ start:222 stop:404 length:183 start_codon:yes stop_codon:yes gene_type:complete